MLVTPLKPIHSNLRRIQMAFGAQKRAHSKGSDLDSSQGSQTTSILDRLQELHLTLLGTMVSIQGNPSGPETKEILNGLRIQIIAFRKIKQLLSENKNGSQAGLDALSKSILVEFYDLEAILRKMVAGKLNPTPKRSSLIAAIAEKSNSAIIHSISRKQ